MPFIDARRFDRADIETDICIVGAGAAGIAMACEFVGTRLRVALMESGGFTFRHGPQLLYRGRNIGLPSFSIAKSRLRRFGGSTTQWAGQCRPLDPIDFETRDWIPRSGWPFGREVLDPYYSRAQQVCSLGPYDYRPETWKDADDGPLPIDSADLEARIYQFSQQPDFGIAYRDKLAKADNIDVLLNTNLVEIETQPPVHEISGLRFTTLGGRKLAVRARAYVLACGGIENPRLLLASNRVAKRGIGNDHDLVGRHFMDHPFFFLGAFEPAESRFDRSFHVIEKYGALRVNAAFGLTEKRQREERLNGASVYFIRRARSKTFGSYFSPGGVAFARLIELARHSELPDGRMWRDIINATKGLSAVAATVARQAREAVRPDPVLVLRATVEPTPQPDSRIMLDEARDRLGVPRAKVDWRMSPDDQRGLDRLLDLMRTELPRMGLGRIVDETTTREDGWHASMSGGKHHMGTTRMHADPRCGVVDPDCRVHGISNLFIAGSSVFPTAGYANPTLTIIALALRLADYLKVAVQPASKHKLPRLIHPKCAQSALPG